MKIVCIAWGSLLWKPEPLPLASAWQHGGPALPLEFARESDGGELALVLSPGAPLLPTRWAWMDTEDLVTARLWLAQREQVDPLRPDGVHSVPAHDGQAAHGLVAPWLQARGFGAAVWTALPPRSRGEEGRLPAVDEAVAYLDGLSGEVRAHAEDYVRSVPADISPPYRKAIEQRLGWLPYQTERDAA